MQQVMRWCLLEALTGIICEGMQQCAAALHFVEPAVWENAMINSRTPTRHSHSRWLLIVHSRTHTTEAHLYTAAMILTDANFNDCVLCCCRALAVAVWCLQFSSRQQQQQ